MVYYSLMTDSLKWCVVCHFAFVYFSLSQASKKMGLLLRSILKTHQQVRPVSSVQWVVRRCYSGKSDITASAMVYSDYGQPSQVLR